MRLSKTRDVIGRMAYGEASEVKVRVEVPRFLTALFGTVSSSFDEVGSALIDIALWILK